MPNTIWLTSELMIPFQNNCPLTLLAEAPLGDADGFYKVTLVLFTRFMNEWDSGDSEGTLKLYFTAPGG